MKLSTFTFYHFRSIFRILYTFDVKGICNLRRFLKVFSGHREMLNSGLCDVVIVSSPNMTHYRILMDIINHPKPHHVLVEKPLCTTVADCKEVGRHDRSIVF